MELHQELRKWITAVIKQRAYLVANGLSRKNSYQIKDNMAYLHRQLDYFPYDTERKMSMFFQRNKGRILSLLPGEGSGGHRKRQEEFHRYDHLTRQTTQRAPRIQMGDQRYGITQAGALA